jgi:hypothetical protein
MLKPELGNRYKWLYIAAHLGAPRAHSQVVIIAVRTEPRSIICLSERSVAYTKGIPRMVTLDHRVTPPHIVYLVTDTNDFPTIPGFVL